SRFAKESVRPVTLKQVHDAYQAHPDADFEVDGVEVSHVCFVGQVRNLSSLTAYNTYKVDDGTSECEVRLWLSVDTAELESMEGIKKPPFMEIDVDSYVKGFGKMSSFGNRHNISAHSIRPISINEYNLHFLESVATHLHLLCGVPTSMQQPNRRLDMQRVTTMPGKRILSPVMSDTARMVVDILSRMPTTNEGLHVQNMASSLGLSSQEILRACEELTAMSVCWSTIDEFTFALLEAS
ncbi:replication factor A protein 2, partial [Ascosphaera atra]